MHCEVWLLLLGCLLRRGSVLWLRRLLIGHARRLGNVGLRISTRLGLVWIILGLRRDRWRRHLRLGLRSRLRKMLLLLLGISLLLPMLAASIAVIRIEGLLLDWRLRWCRWLGYG